FTGTYRYPLSDYGLDNLAPYGIAGIGRQWEHAPTWFFDFGAGAKYRFQQNLGFFADLRGVFPLRAHLDLSLAMPSQQVHICIHHQPGQIGKFRFRLPTKLALRLSVITNQ